MGELFKCFSRVGLENARAVIGVHSEGEFYFQFGGVGYSTPSQEIKKIKIMPWLRVW